MGMKNSRKDYNNRFVDTQGKIPDNEPVFVLRGQDKFAAETVRFYANKVATERGTAFGIVVDSRTCADEMDKWPKKKSPDDPERSYHFTEQQRDLSQVQLTMEIEDSRFIEHCDRVVKYGGLSEDEIHSLLSVVEYKIRQGSHLAGAILRLLDEKSKMISKSNIDEIVREQGLLAELRHEAHAQKLPGIPRELFSNKSAAESMVLSATLSRDPITREVKGFDMGDGARMNTSPASRLESLADESIVVLADRKNKGVVSPFTGGRAVMGAGIGIRPEDRERMIEAIEQQKKKDGESDE